MYSTAATLMAKDVPEVLVLKTIAERYSLGGERRALPELSG
jgi:hypothetical protein